MRQSIRIEANDLDEPKDLPMNSSAWLKTVGLLALCAVVAGCPARKTEKIIVRGSNTIGEELAPRLIDEYRKTHPSVTFDLEAKGTSYGTAALMVERCDIAAASRPQLKSTSLGARGEARPTA